MQVLISSDNETIVGLAFGAHALKGFYPFS